MLIQNKIADSKQFDKMHKSCLTLQKSNVGITNQIAFNDIFERNYFVLDIIEYSPTDGMKKIAFWNPDDKVQNLRTAEETLAQRAHTLQNKTLIVT